MKVKVAVVVYPLLTIAILLFLTSSPSPHHHITLHRGIRVGNHPRHTHPFDPYLVAKFVQGTPSFNAAHTNDFMNPPASSDHWETTNPFAGVFEDADEYFAEDGDLNVEARLRILFPLLDWAPEDGSVSFKELEAWNVHQAKNQLIHTTQMEMDDHDKDGDGEITFAEYLPLFSKHDLDKNDMSHGQAGWWKEKFDCADADGNGNLSFTEFMDFLHPEDSDNEQVQRWYLKEKFRGMDHDKDGKINFDEFRKQAYENFKHNFNFENGGDYVPSPEEKFRELDVNGDRLLTEEEMRSIIHYLQPGELTYAKHYTKYLIHESDDDNDGELTLDEMLDHHEIFYNTVVTDSDYDEIDDFHDEF